MSEREGAAIVSRQKLNDQVFRAACDMSSGHIGALEMRDAIDAAFVNLLAWNSRRASSQAESGEARAADRAAVANHIADMAALWSQCKIGDEAWCVWQDTYGDEIPGSLSDAIRALAAKLARGEGHE